MSAELALKLRYCNLQNHSRTDMSEELVHREFVDVRIPASAAGIVLIDVWDRHYLRSHLERAMQIVRGRVVPLLDACRRAGIAVIHAPAREAAQKYPQWVRYAGDEELYGSKASDAPAWPPEQFRNRTGPYECFARLRPKPPLDRLITEQRKRRRIIPEVEPEPEDFVVATGRQLHRLCRHLKLLHLFYLGFATNMCVLARDYGIRAMASRGYNCILIRDCTTGIESAETLPNLALTEAAIWEVEMLHGFSVTSTELIAACQQAIEAS